VVNFNYVSSPVCAKSKGSPNVRRLLIKVLEALKLSNKQHMGSFCAQTCKTDCLHCKIDVWSLNMSPHVMLSKQTRVS